MKQERLGSSRRGQEQEGGEEGREREREREGGGGGDCFGAKVHPVRSLIMRKDA